MELANQGSTSDHASLEDVLRGIEAAWSSGDPHGYAPLYAMNASYVSRAGMLLNGRAEIEQLHATTFAGELRNTRLVLKVRQSSFLAAVVAVVHADVEINRLEGENNSTRAITTFVFGKIEEAWRICTAHRRN